MTSGVKSLQKISAVAFGLLLSVWKLLAVIFGLFCITVVCIAFSDCKGIGDSIYLGFITFLTVGYGDITPESPLARVACIVLGFAGIAFMGIVIAATIKAIEKS